MNEKRNRRKEMPKQINNPKRKEKNINLKEQRKKLGRGIE